MLERGQQERAEAAQAGRHVVDEAALEEAREERLGEILRVLRVVAAAADVGVQGIPVVLAQPAERRVRPRGIAVGAGRQHDAPVGGGEGRRGPAPWPGTSAGLPRLVHGRDDGHAWPAKER
jgi:hypothetical protein